MSKNWPVCQFQKRPHYCEYKHNRYGAYQNHLSGSLNGLSYGAQILHDVRNLDFKLGTRNRVGLGYQFLKNYISVWDYKHRRLTLLKP